MYHFLFPSDFDEDAGQPTVKKGATSVYANLRKGGFVWKYCISDVVELTFKQNYLYSRYQRIAARRGGKRALIAIAHTMPIAIDHMLKEKVPYCELGSDYYTSMQSREIFVR